jgi:hypothetical protein
MDMSELDATLLREAFDALNPNKGGSSDEAMRALQVREKIGRCLAEHGKPVMGGGPGISPQSVSASGGNGFSSGTAHFMGRAKATGRPVCYAGGGGGGIKGYGDWIFPDGHTERLPAGETPKWPKDDPVRDAVRANQ